MTELAIQQTPVEDLREEILAILTAADRALDTRDIQARSDLSDGAASLSQPLASLRRDGAIESEHDPRRGRWRYRIAGEPESSGEHTQPQPPAETPEPAGHGRRSREDRVLEALREAHPTPMRGAEIAHQLGLGTKATSCVLGTLRRRGLVARTGPRNAHALWHYLDAGIQGDGTGEPLPELPDEPLQPARWGEGHGELEGKRATPLSERTPITDEPFEPPAPEGPAAPGKARYAYRSDGTLLVEAWADGPAIELSREDAERLHRYLRAIGGAVLDASAA